MAFKGQWEKILEFSININRRGNLVHLAEKKEQRKKEDS
jgi:hypothetical protein